MYYYSNRLFLSFYQSLNHLKYIKHWNLNYYNCFSTKYKYSIQNLHCNIINGFSNVKNKLFIHTHTPKEYLSQNTSNDNINNNFNTEDVTLLGRDTKVSEFISDNSEIDRILYIIRNTSPNEMNDYIFETIDKNILTYYDRFTFNDLNTLLQMTLKNFYSQNVIKAVVLKMQNFDPSELSVNTLSLLIQNLGRLQASDLEFDRIKRFLDNSCSHIMNLDNLSETNLSSIIYGFQRLHYVNHEFLNKIVKRYNRDLLGVNINSLVISFSSIIKLNYFNLSMILQIYSQISKSIYNMTLQTTIQFINTISKIHDFYISNDNNKEPNCNKEDEKITSKKLYKLNKSNYNLMNYMVKNVCDNYSPVVNMVQSSLILNAMNKIGFKKSTYISTLINTIASNNNKALDEIENDKSDLNGGIVKHDENEELYDVDVEPTGLETNKDVLVLKSKIDNSLKEINIRDSKNKEKNILNFKEFPECPFNREKTIKKLQGEDPNHLILICESLFGLDYYTDYSVNLMFVIKEIINPMLHELKANNIMMFLLSFTNINFKDYQIERLKLKKNIKDVNSKQLECLINSLDNNENYNRGWFDRKNLVNSDRLHLSYDENNHSKFSQKTTDEHSMDLKDKLMSRLDRSEWKEELVLNCFENMLRHIHFIKTSESMMKRFRHLFTLLTSGIYLPNYPVYFKLLELIKERSNQYKDHEINVKWIENLEKVPAILPENIIQNLVDLYLNKDLDSEVKRNNINNQKLDLDSNDIDHKDKNQDSNSIGLYKFGNRTLYVDREVFGLKIPILITTDEG